MVEWAATDDRLHAFGERATVAIGVDGWRPGGDPPTLGSRVDAVAVGSAHGLGLPDGSPLLVDGEQRVAGERLSSGAHEVAVNAALETSVAFEGPAALEGEIGRASCRERVCLYV